MHSADGGLLAAHPVRDPVAQGPRHPRRARRGLWVRPAPAAGRLCATRRSTGRAGGGVLLWRLVGFRTPAGLQLGRASAGGARFRHGHRRLPALSRRALSGLPRRWGPGRPLGARPCARPAARSSSSPPRPQSAKVRVGGGFVGRRGDAHHSGDHEKSAAGDEQRASTRARRARQFGAPHHVVSAIASPLPRPQNPHPKQHHQQHQ